MRAVIIEVNMVVSSRIPNWYKAFDSQIIKKHAERQEVIEPPIIAKPIDL